MKSITLLLKSILPLLLVLVTTNISWAQFPRPVCSGNGAGKLYYVNSTSFEIYILDPSRALTAFSTPTAPANPRPTGITLPAGAGGALAIGTNYGTGPNPTYFTTGVIGAFKYLQYWNGTTWVSTGAIMNVDNIGGSCGTILGLDAFGFVYKWTGGTSTSAPFLKDVSTNIGSLDIAGDCSGGFWVINQSGTPQNLRKYDAAGNLMQTFTYTSPSALGGGGLSINGNAIYYDGADGELYRGIVNTATSTVTFTRLTTTAPFSAANTPVSDFASCGFEGACLGKGAFDSIVACIDTARVTLSATGPGPYNWTVLSGPATITGTGQTVLVKAGGPAVITYKDADCTGANTITDTTVIFVTRATVDAGPDDTIIGCRGYFPDTLHATLADTTLGVTWQYDWGPLDGSIVCCNTTLDPIIAPTVTKKFWLTVTAINGCTFSDTVKISVADSTPRANFTYLINQGCDQDTVKFINTTPTNVFINFVEWNFGDSIGNNNVYYTSNSVSTSHIFRDQGIYSVLLTVSNQYCLDTIRKAVNILHPLVAAFNVDDDSVCTGTPVKFTDRSITTGPNPTFFYTFGDGDSSHLSNLTHTYKYTGIYRVRLVVSDVLGCIDTTYRTIVVDSLPFVRFIAPDSQICEGTAVRLVANYLGVGNTGVTVNLGDGTIFQNSDTVVYAFARADIYHVTLTAHYRICPDAVFNQDIVVNPFPGVNIGPDTVLCPNGSAIVLTDQVNINNPAAKYLWNTGDTTASILARDIGTYWARATIGGCSGTDSLLVHKDCYVDIPNSFTPNGDGSNDYFLPRQFLSRSVNSFKMSIFNRWGQVIYQSSTVNGRGWDGKFNEKDQPQGVYVYIIDVSFDNGVKEHYTGNVTLLR